jgi:hypothetical protein
VARRGTGPSEPYSPDDEASVTEWLEDALDAYYDDPSDQWPEYYDDDDDDRWLEEPRQISVVADVEWAGTFNAQAHRMLRADELDLSRVLAAVAAAKRIREGHRLSTYTARTTLGRVHHLQRTAVGRSYLAQAGVSARAIRSWDRGTARPSAASRQRIDEAYEAAANRLVTSAEERRAAAVHRVAEALSDALSDRYGAEIRVRDITSLDVS